MNRFAAARNRWVTPFSWPGRRNVGPRAAAFSPVFGMCQDLRMRDFKHAGSPVRRWLHRVAAPWLHQTINQLLLKL